MFSLGTPQVVEDLRGKHIVKIGVGRKFSVFLTAKGQVLTCGSADFTCLSQTDANLYRPCPILGLEQIVDISVGAEHVLALSDKGQVYGWGNNFGTQLGLDPQVYEELVTKPVLIPGLANIKQISAGNYHSAAWTSDALNSGSLLSFGTPEQVPEKYDLIQNVEISKLKDRLVKLNQVSELVKNSWRYLPRDYVHCNSQDPLSLNILRQTFDPSTYNLPLVRTLQSTTTIGKQSMQQVSVKRYLKSMSAKPKNAKKKFKWNSSKKKICENGKIPAESTIFYQVSSQILNNFNAHTLRLPSQAWKVKLVGEGADDAGGVFDDVMSEMCHEITGMLLCPAL